MARHTIKDAHIQDGFWAALQRLDAEGGTYGGGSVMLSRLWEANGRSTRYGSTPIGFDATIEHDGTAWLVRDILPHDTVQPSAIEAGRDD